jgi:NADPH:quinone reductase
MKAAWYDDLGPAKQVLQVGELPTPVPCHGEVLIRLHASGVNPSDVKSRSGAFGRARFLGRTVPHSDGAGQIVEVGTGVPDSRVGERVWTWNAQYKRTMGTAAQFVALPAQMAVPLPDRVSYEEGACLGVPAMTASQAVRLAELEPGCSVLVSGGAGAVGHYAIQMAKSRGARVLTTVSSSAKAAHATKAGADAAINYRDEDVAARVQELTGGEGLDALIELDLGANAQLIQLLRMGGRVAVYGVLRGDVEVPARWMLQNAISVRFLYVYEQPPAMRVEVIREITALMRDGKLINPVGATFPLEKIAEAHEAVENASVIGNVVVTM